MSPAALASDVIVEPPAGERTLGSPAAEVAAWRSLVVFAGYREDAPRVTATFDAVTDVGL